MEKVICIRCGSVGYTASPRFVRCSECGGRHKIIRFNGNDLKKQGEGVVYENIDSTFK